MLTNEDMPELTLWPQSLASHLWKAFNCHSLQSDAFRNATSKSNFILNNLVKSSVWPQGGGIYVNFSGCTMLIY